ncbi:MAG TPA: hypothetical protein DCR35_08780 [Runella sp.]|nr:hypothetical protein [Runella sp.]HAO49376.1 hypothetical protein [Runella sp.]
MRFLSLFTVLTLLIYSSLYAQSAPSSDTTGSKTQADKLFLSGKYQQAKELYEKAKQVPGSENDDYLIMQLENCDKCLGFWRSIQELSKDADAARVTMTVYEKILDINPKDSTVQATLMTNYWTLAKQRYQQLDFQRAGELFRKVSGYPQSPYTAEARILADSSDIYAKSLTEGFIAPDVEVPAAYASGLKGISNVIANNMRYPEKAAKEKISGKVWLGFIINEKGKVIPESVRVIKGIGGGCDEEAMRLIKLMNNWSPAVKWGKPVRFQNTFGITFSLGKE